MRRWLWVVLISACAEAPPDLTQCGQYCVEQSGLACIAAVIACCDGTPYCTGTVTTDAGTCTVLPQDCR